MYYNNVTEPLTLLIRTIYMLFDVESTLCAYLYELVNSNKKVHGDLTSYMVCRCSLINTKTFFFTCVGQRSTEVKV